MKTVLKYATVLAVAGATALAMSTASEAKTKKIHRVAPVAAELVAGGFYYGPGVYGPWANAYAYAPGAYAYAPGVYPYTPQAFAYATDTYAYAPGPGPYAYARGPYAYDASDPSGYGAYAYTPGFYASAGFMSCVTEGTYGKPLDYGNC